MTNTKQNKGDGVDENFKSDFLTDAEQAQQKLDTVSPSMCLAKWKQLSLHLTTGMNNSCYHPPKTLKLLKMLLGIKILRLVMLK